MFSFVKDLFKKATGEIQFANESINETKEYVNKLATSPSNDYQRKIDEFCTSFNIIEQEIIDLETHVVESGKRLGLLDGVDFGSISLFGANQEGYVALETEVDSMLTRTTGEEYFSLIDASSLSEVDKEEAKELYLGGNKRASMAIFIRSDYDKAIESKEDEISLLYEEMISDPHYNLYESYIRYQDPGIIESDPVLKEASDAINKYLDEIAKKEEELAGLQHERYIINCSVNLWSFDYLDEVVKTEDFKEKSTNTTSIDLLIKDLEGRYTYNGGVITESDYQDACKSLGINPDTVNKILLWESMRESDVLGRYFTEGGITEEDMANWGLLTDFNTETSLEARGAIYLTDEEKAKYNYLYETEGAERATEYLLALEDEINRIQSMKILDEMLTSLDDADKVIGRIFRTYGFGFSSGVTNSLNDIFTFFNKNTTMTSQEYADMYFLTMLATSEYTKPLDLVDLELARREGRVDEERYKELKSMTNPTNADLLYAQGMMTSVERDGWRMLAENESYQSFVSKIEGSKFLGASEGDALTTVYGAASSTGRMALSLAMSYAMAGAGAANLGRLLASSIMFTQTYGSSYKQGVRSGANELDSNMFALLSAGSEVCFELVLGGLKGIAIGEDVIDTAVDIKKATKYLDIIKYSAIDFLESTGKEIGEETLQEILGMALANQYLNEPFDFTKFEEDYLQFAMSVIISTSTMNAPSNMMNVSTQTIDYIKFGKNDQMSFQIGENLYVNFTGDELRSMMDSEGNIDSTKLSECIENKLTNQEFSNTPTATVVKPEKSETAEIETEVESLEKTDKLPVIQEIETEVESLEKTDELPVIQEIKDEVESLEKTDKLPVIQEIENEVDTFEIFGIEEDNVAYAPIEESSNTINYNQALQNDGLEPIVFSFEEELLTKLDSNLIVEYLNKSYLPNSIKLLLAKTLSNNAGGFSFFGEKSDRFKILDSVKDDLTLCTEIIKTLTDKEKVEALEYVKNDTTACLEVIKSIYNDMDKLDSLDYIKNDPEACKEAIKSMQYDANKADGLDYIKNDLEACKEIINTMIQDSYKVVSLSWVKNDLDFCKQIIESLNDETWISKGLKYVKDDVEFCKKMIEQMTHAGSIAESLDYIKSDPEAYLKNAEKLSDSDKMQLLGKLKYENPEAAFKLALTINDSTTFAILTATNIMGDYNVELIRQKYKQFDDNTKKELIYSLPQEESKLKFEIFATLGFMTQNEVLNNLPVSEQAMFRPLYEKVREKINSIFSTATERIKAANQRIMQNQILGTSLNFDYEGARNHVNEVFGINNDCVHFGNSLNKCLEYFEKFIRTKPEYANYNGNVVEYYLESLPEDIKIALKIYTSSLFDKINNDYTRKHNGEIEDKNEYLTYNGKSYLINDVIHEIDNFLSQNTLKEDIILYRGVGGGRTFRALGINSPNDLYKLNSGTFYQPDYGFGSATAISTGGFTFTKDVNMVLRVKAGTELAYIDPISSFTGEQEVLLQRNCIYRYIGAEEVEINGIKKWYVYAEVEPMSDELMQSLKGANIETDSIFNVEEVSIKINSEEDLNNILAKFLGVKIDNQKHDLTPEEAIFLANNSNLSFIPEKISEYLNNNFSNDPTMAYYTLLNISGLEFSDSDTKSWLLSEIINQNQMVREVIKKEATNQVSDMLSSMFNVNDSLLTQELVDSLLGVDFLENGIQNNPNWDGFISKMEIYIKNKFDELSITKEPILWGRVNDKDHQIMNDTYTTIENTTIGNGLYFLDLVYSNWDQSSSNIPKLEDFWSSLSTLYVDLCCNSTNPNTGDNYNEIRFVTPYTTTPEVSFGHIFQTNELPTLIKNGNIKTINLTMVVPETMAILEEYTIDISSLIDEYGSQLANNPNDKYLNREIFTKFQDLVIKSFYPGYSSNPSTALNWEIF